MLVATDIAAALPELQLQFSGFPFVSLEAQERATSLSRLGSFWTLTRIAWGIVALTTVLEDWLDSAKTQETAYAVVLVSLYMAGLLLLDGLFCFDNVCILAYALYSV